MCLQFPDTLLCLSVSNSLPRELRDSVPSEGRKVGWDGAPVFTRVKRLGLNGRPCWRFFHWRVFFTRHNVGAIEAPPEIFQYHSVSDVRGDSGEALIGPP